jgi:hypothetical protein
MNCGSLHLPALLRPGAVHGALLPVVALVALSLSCELFRSARPVPEEKKEFVGVWRSRSGFLMRIRAAGTATVSQVPDTGSADALALNIRVAAPVVNDLRVEFQGDSAMLLITPLLYARSYRVDARPRRDGDTVTMVLNGVTLFRR